MATAELVVTAAAPLDAAAAYDDDDEAAALTRAIKRARTWRDVGKLYQRRVRQHQQQQQQLDGGAAAPATSAVAAASALNPVHSSAMLAHLAQLAQQAERREERQTADASPELWDAAAVSPPLGASAALAAAAAAAAAAANGNNASVWRDSLDDPSGGASSGDDSLGSSGGCSGDEAEPGQQQQQQQQPSRPLSAKALRSRRSRLVASLTALSAQHLSEYDARGASNALWALVSLGAPPPRAWLASFCAATLPLLQQHSGGDGGDDGALFDAQALATSAWALARARHRPPEAWLQAWQCAVAEELFVDDGDDKEEKRQDWAAQHARALGTALWACPALGVGDDTAWFQRAIASLARHLDAATDAAQATAAADQEQAVSEDDEDNGAQPRCHQQLPRLDQVAANVLWACVRLGQRPPDALWRALARHLRLVGGQQGAGARSAAGILWAQASLAAANTAAPSSDADAVAELLLHDPAAPERLARAGPRELATLAWATGALCRRSSLLPPEPWRSALLAAFLARLNGERKQRSDVAGRQLVALLTGVSWWCATADYDAKATRLPEGWLAAVLLDDEQPSASSAAAAAALLPRLSTPALAALLSALARLARTSAAEHRVPTAWAARAAAEVQRRGYGAGSSPASLAALARAVAALSASSSSAAVCGTEWTAGLLAASQPRLHAMPAAHLASLATAVLALGARPNGPWVGAWAGAMAARADEGGAETAADLSLGARVLAQLASSSSPSSSSSASELMALHANAERVAIAALEATAAAYELAAGATLPAHVLASLVWSASALLPRPAPARATAATARLLKAAHPGDLVTGLPSPHSAALLLKGAAALDAPPPPMLRGLLLSRVRREWSSASLISSARDLADLALGLARLPKPPQKDVLAVCERAADLAAASNGDGNNGHNAIAAHAVVSVVLKALAEAGVYCAAPKRTRDIGQVHRAARARALVHRSLHASAEALPLLRAGELAALAAALARARCVPPPAWQQRFAAATGARLASGAASPRELAALLEALASISTIGARCGPAAIGGGGAAAAPDVCAVADAAAASARQLLLASTSPRQEQQQESGPRSAAAAAVAATMMLPLPRAWLLRAAAEASSRARSGAWAPDDLARGMWGIGTLLLVAASSAVVAAAELPSERGGSSSKSGSGSSSGSSTPADDAAAASPAASPTASPVGSGRLRRDGPGASSTSSASAATAAEVADALARRLEQAVAAVVTRGGEQQQHQGAAWWLLVLEAMAALRTVARNGDPPPLPAASAVSRRTRGAGDGAEAPPAWLEEWVAEARRTGLGAADGNNARRAAVAVRLLGGRPPREWLLLPPRDGAASTVPALYVPSPSPLQPRRPWSPAPRGDSSSSSRNSLASSSSARREAVATAVAVAAAAATAAASVAAPASSSAEQADEQQDSGGGSGATATTTTVVGLSPRPARRVTAAAAV